MDELKKEFFTMKEVAEKCGTSYGIVKSDIDRGCLPSYRIGRKYFIAREDMEKYIENVTEKRGIEGYTIKEILQKIPVSYAFIMDLIKSKKLPAVKVGRQYIVSKVDFETFLQNRKI